MLLTTGKGAFLEFLRNLTPQILLFSIAIVMASKLDLNKFDLSNFWGTLPFLMVIGVFLCAAIANMLMFFEKSCESLDWVNDESKRLHIDGIKGWSHIEALAKILIARNKALFLELLIAGLVVQVGFVVVFFTSIQGATSLYHAIHGK